MILFTLLTFAGSWILWAAASRVLGGDFAHPGPPAHIGNALYLLGVFAPAFVALLLTSVRDGSGAAKELLRRVIAWSVDARWYAFAILYFPVVKLAVAVVHRLALGVWPGFWAEPLVVMLAATVLSTPVQAGEEIGWRGFLLPRLAARIGLPSASLVVGVIWAAWHLPFFFIAGTDKTGQSFPAYAAGVVALSVALAFLYWRTRGSLFLTMVMHAAVNNIRLVATVPSTGGAFAVRASFASWATSAVMWAAAAGFLIAMRGAALFSRPARDAQKV